MEVEVFNLNNLEIQCLEFAIDILTNRPKNLNGEISKYDKQDKDIMLKNIYFQREAVENNKKHLTVDCYNLLIELYDGLVEIIIKCQI